jgi:hypothetical protein
MLYISGPDPGRYQHIADVTLSGNAFVKMLVGGMGFFDISFSIRLYKDPLFYVVDR